MKILLVEPDKILASEATRAFTKANHEVVSVATAQSAIHALDDFMPHVLVLELALPKSNGIDVLQELRSYSDLSSIKIVVYSHIAPRDAAALDDFDVAAVLDRRRTSLSELVAIVEQVLQK